MPLLKNVNDDCVKYLDGGVVVKRASNLQVRVGDLEEQ
jgi:hypothetical protein